jgi:cysteine synthase
MVCLNRAQRDFRQRTESTIECGLPSLIEMSPPTYVREAEWFRAAKLSKILKVYFLPCYKIEKFSGKLMPAFRILTLDEAAGKFDDHPIVIVPTSGNFGKEIAALARAFGIREVWAIVNYGTPVGKLNHLRVSGARVKIAPKGVSATDYAYELAQKPGRVLIDQYTHEGSILGHEPTMKHIVREMIRLEGNAGFMFGAVTGTCSTLVAAHRYLRGNVPGKVEIFGVASMSPEEKVPAARSRKELDDLKKIGGFCHRPEWEDVLDYHLVDSVTRHEAFALNGERFREASSSMGPTGALLEAGAYHLLRHICEVGHVDSLKNEQEMVSFCLLAMDSHLAYIGDPKYRSALIGPR